MERYVQTERPEGLSDGEIREAVEAALAEENPRRVLLIPPDFTRYHSNAGRITNLCWHLLRDRGAQVDILPALGTHVAMTQAECAAMYGDIPYAAFLYHNWRTDVCRIGEIPGDFIVARTQGLWTDPVSVEINRRVLDPSYDLLISVGQVVPHEVVGLSNYTKNLFVGVGGADMIHKSHMVGAVYGLERMMGRDHSPVREIYDYALEQFLRPRGISPLFMLTVTTAPEGQIRTHGLFIGRTRTGFERAAALTREKNLIYVEKPIKKCVVYLPPEEFRSTWLGNKAVYRTRMAMADGGELIVLAPGVEKFGEDGQIDALIRKYGYRGRLRTLELFRENQDLQQNMGTAAHLIHGSSDGRFAVTYAVRRISRAEICGVGFQAADYGAAEARYPHERLTPGWNTLPDGEEIYYIPNPALGLWTTREKLRMEG